jgi:glycerol-3-phosphate acyltransferase PlsY
MNWARVIAALVLGYGLGAIPFSFLIAKVLQGVDLREVGSRSTSPSNLYRVVGPLPGVAAGVLEVGKGVVGPLVALNTHPLVIAGAGGLAVLAHNWPVLTPGGGGRGLSTATGALAVLAWPAGLLMCAGLVIGGVTRRVYPAMSVVLILLVPLVGVLRGWQVALGAAIIVTPIGWKSAAIVRRRRRDERLQRLRDGRQDGVD